MKFANYACVQEWAAIVNSCHGSTHTPSRTVTQTKLASQSKSNTNDLTVDEAMKVGWSEFSPFIYASWDIIMRSRSEHKYEQNPFSPSSSRGESEASVP